MAAAGGKKESVSLSLFMKVVNNLEEEELSTMATLAWAREEKMGKRTARVLEEAGSDVEASERSCRSCHV